MPAIPDTMVQNMIGAISMVIILINVSLMVLAVDAKPGKYTPAITPSIMANNTWKVKLVRRRFISDSKYSDLLSDLVNE